MPATKEIVIAVFPSRDVLEEGIESLLGSGFNQAQVSLVAADTTVEDLKRQTQLDPDQTQASIDRADTGNVQGILAGIPAYVAATLAAGVTVASGGALAGVALAALGGAAGGGLLGAGAAGYFKGKVDARYEDQLARGGFIILVTPSDEAQIEDARRVLMANGALHVDTTRFEDAPTHAQKAEPERPESTTGGPVFDSSNWTG